MKRHRVKSYIFRFRSLFTDHWIEKELKGIACEGERKRKSKRESGMRGIKGHTGQVEGEEKKEQRS